MRPRRAVIDLSETKRRLRTRICARRELCGGAASRLAEPLGWLEVARLACQRMPAAISAVRSVATDVAGFRQKEPRGAARWIHLFTAGLCSYRFWRDEVDWWSKVTGR